MIEWPLVIGCLTGTVGLVATWRGGNLSALRKVISDQKDLIDVMDKKVEVLSARVVELEEQKRFDASKIAQLQASTDITPLKDLLRKQTEVLERMGTQMTQVAASLATVLQYHMTEQVHTDMQKG